MRAHPTPDTDDLVSRILEMVQIFRQGIFVKLRQKLCLGAGVDRANFIDELTFIHGLLTFAKGFADKPMRTNGR